MYAYSTASARAYFGHGDLNNDVPESTRLIGTDFSVLASRYPNGFIDINIPDTNLGYRSELLFPEYCEQGFSCEPVKKIDLKEKIIANGGTFSN